MSKDGNQRGGWGRTCELTLIGSASMSLFGRRIRVGAEDFPRVAAKLARILETLRSEYYFGSLSQLRREGIDVSMLPPTLPPHGELEAALKGFQLTCTVGIAWRYIEGPRDELEFERLLCERMGATKEVAEYREKYLDCQGDITSLVLAVADDVFSAIGRPEPRSEFLPQFRAGAELLIGLSQLWTYAACGDRKMERRLKRRIGIPLK